jgi:hypothetical protein
MFFKRTENLQWAATQHGRAAWQATCQTLYRRAGRSRPVRLVLPNRGWQGSLTRNFILVLTLSKYEFCIFLNYFEACARY